jgi:hypothetical protein
VPPRTSRPSPSFAKGHGEGRPLSDVLTVSSHTSPRNPNPAKTPVLTLNDAPHSAMLILNGG